MNDNLNPGITEKFKERPTVNVFRQRIYGEGLSLDTDLDETKLGPVGVFSQKLSIKSERPLLPATVQQVFEYFLVPNEHSLVGSWRVNRRRLRYQKGA